MAYILSFREIKVEGKMVIVAKEELKQAQQA